MKKLIWTISTLFIFCLTLSAQNDLVPVVYSITGKVKYATDAESKSLKIRPGISLAPDGMLKIYPGATLGIIYDEEYALISTAGEQKVSAILDNVSLFQETDLAELVGERVDEAIDPFFQVRSGFAVAGDPPPRPPTKPIKDGHGDKDHGIIRLQPSGGKVSGDEISFSWTMPDNNSDLKRFLFTLRSADGAVLWQKEKKGFDLELDSDDYPFENGKNYTWQVSDPDDPSVNSAEISFQYVAPAHLGELRRSLREHPMYQSADPVAKTLLEATALEQADFTAAAYELLRTAARKNKKNQLARLLFESFQWRKDMIE